MNIEKKLHRISSDVQESLRFAEAKNAALITFNGAALYVIIEGNAHLPRIAQQNIQIIAAVLVLAVTLSLIAFLPNLSTRYRAGKKTSLSEWKSHKKLGIFYFGHIRRYGDEEFLSKVYEHYGSKLAEPISKAELDLSKQTIILSQITRHKYLFFSIAGHLTLIALILPIPILFVYWFLVYINKYTEVDLPV